MPLVYIYWGSYVMSKLRHVMRKAYFLAPDFSKSGFVMAGHGICPE